jgi:hypothetical protein
VETCQGPRCKTSVHEVTSSEHADHGKGTRTSRASAAGEENDDLETQHRKTNKDRKQKRKQDDLVRTYDRERIQAIVGNFH